MIRALLSLLTLAACTAPPGASSAPPFRVFARVVRADDVLCAGGEPQVAGEVARCRADGTVLARVRVGDDVVYGLAVAPGGGFACIACADGRVLRLALPDLAPVEELWRHAAPAVALAFSTGGEVLATAGDDGRVLLGAPAPGSAPRALVDHTAGVTSLAWSPDGARLASGAGDGKVRCHDRAGRLLRTWNRLGGAVVALHWLPGPGGLVATVAGGPDEPAHDLRLELD